MELRVPHSSLVTSLLHSPWKHGPQWAPQFSPVVIFYADEVSKAQILSSARCRTVAGPQRKPDNTRL